MDLSPRMEINLRRLAANDPKPLMLNWSQAASLERRGLVTMTMHWRRYECRLTDEGRRVADDAE